MNNLTAYKLGIDIGSTTVKIAVLDDRGTLLFSDYERHFANIQETLALLLGRAEASLGDLTLAPAITGSGGLALAGHLKVPFIQEVVAVAQAHLALRGLLHLIPALGLGHFKQLGLGLMAAVEDAEKVVPQGHIDALGGIGVVVGGHLFLAAQKIGQSFLVIHGGSSLT